MGGGRLRLLCCWGYSRAGWVAPLEALGADHGFDLTYLFHRRAEDETAVATAWPRRYWLEFRSAQQVLDDLHPDRIVFMGLDGAWTIALNAVARRRGIPTFLLQHGIEWPSSYFPSRWPEDRRGLPVVTRTTPGGRLPAIRFSAASMWNQPGALALSWVLLLLAARTPFPRAAGRIRFAARRPDLHLVTGPASALAPIERDGAGLQEIIVVGLPELSDLLRPMSAPARGSDHVLIVDSPLNISCAEKEELFRRLARQLAPSGLRLRVKVHPYDYEWDWRSDDDVVFIRDGDMRAEIQNAVAIVGFDSTLMIAAMQHRPVILVRTGRSFLIDLVSRESPDSVVNGLGALSAASVLRGIGAAASGPFETVIEAFSGPRPWSIDRLATAIRDPSSVGRLDPDALTALQRYEGQ